MDLITKITAPNPGVFTGGGTNTYLIGKDDITLVDPGPNISEHLNEIIKAGDGKIKESLLLIPIKIIRQLHCLYQKRLMFQCMEG